MKKWFFGFKKEYLHRILFLESMHSMSVGWTRSKDTQCPPINPSISNTSAVIMLPCDHSTGSLIPFTVKDFSINMLKTYYKNIYLYYKNIYSYYKNIYLYYKNLPLQNNFDNFTGVKLLELPWHFQGRIWNHLPKLKTF